MERKNFYKKYKRSVGYREELVESLKDHDEIVAYLNARSLSGSVE